MRTKYTKLLSLLVCIGGILFFFLCKCSYESKVADLNKKAEESFAKAIDLELKSRKLEGNISLNLNLSTTSTDILDTIYWEDKFGRHKYILDPEKSAKNITSDSNIRSLHSIAFGKHPLLVDSLNAKWKDQLQSSNVFVKSALCITLTSIDGSVKSQKSQHSEWRCSSNLAFLHYIGYACEIEIKGYLYYSIWGLIYKEILLYLLLCSILIYVFYKYSIFLRYKIKSLRSKEIVEVVNEVKKVEIIKEIPIEVIKEIPVEVIKEIPVEVIKEVPVEIIKEVQKMDATPMHSYKLGENIIFHAEQNIVVKDGLEYHIKPQLGLLLKLFLDERDNEYILRNDIIINKLWPDGTGNKERMHKAIARLRLFFKEIDFSLTIINKSEVYQLIISGNSPE